jgi:integrase
MASFSKRTYFSWRLVCTDEPSLNATFASEVSANARLLELSEQGHSGVKIKKFSSLGWQARVRRNGFPLLVKTFPRRDMAEQWATEREAEMHKRQFVDYREAARNTLGDLLRKYDSKRLSGRPKQDPDRARLAKLSETPIAMIRMSILQASDFIEYRDERCKMVKGSTVKKELEVFCAVISLARRDWRINLPVNPACGALMERPGKVDGDERVRRLKEKHTIVTERAEPTSPSGPTQVQAKRRLRAGIEYENDTDTAVILALPQSEQQALFRACRYPHWYTQRKRQVTAATLKARAQRAVAAPIKARLRPGRLIWSLASFAIETAMRRGEMLKLQWSHTHLADGYLDLPDSITKNRKPRLVPLSLRARRILAAQPRTGETVFDTNVNTVKLGFKRAFERAGCVDLRLHDLRHEATSRLFERTDLRESEIGYITGHTDPRMLQRYYNKRPEEFVDRFNRSCDWPSLGSGSCQASCRVRLSNQAAF